MKNTMKKSFAKLAMFLALAALVAGGAFAQRVGDTVQIGGQTYSILSVSGDTVVLQRVQVPQPFGGQQFPQQGGGGGLPLPQTGGQGQFNGAWITTTNSNFAAAGTILNFSGDGAVIAQVGSSSLWQTARNRGFISVGIPFVRYIANTGSNTYSCEVLAISFSGNANDNPTVTGTRWERGSITVNTNGTIVVGYGSGERRGTFRRN